MFKFDDFSCILKNNIKLHYVALFKGGVAFVVVILISLSQVYPKLMELNFDAKESIFELEEKYNIKLNEESCKNLKAEKAKCRLALYKQMNLDNSKRILTLTIIGSYFIAIALLFLSFTGFTISVIKNRDA